jgi:MFS family permease
MTGATRFGQMYAPLRVANYRNFLIGQTISTMGSLIQMTAQSWVVYELTRSSAALGTIAMLGSLPLLLVSPYAGTLADRVDRRKLLYVTQAALAALAATLAILVQTGTVQLWHLYALAVVTGIVTALDGPALQAFAADLTGPALVRQAVSLNMMGFQVSRMVGPSVAGLLVGYYGSATAFWVNAASFLAVILALLRVKFNADGTGVPRARRAGQAPGTTMDAVRHVLRNPTVVNFYLYPLLYMLGGATTMTLYPVYVGDTLHRDARALGTIIGAWGAGNLATSFLILPLVQNVRRTGILSAFLLVWFGAMLALLRVIALPAAMATIESFGGRFGIPDPIVVAASIVTFLSGITGPIVLSMASGLQQAMAPPDMRARLAALGTTITFGSQPVVNLAVGYTGEAFGAPTALLINAGILTGLVALLVALRPSVRAEVIRPHTMVKPPDAPSAPETASLSAPSPNGATESGVATRPAEAVLATTGAPASGTGGVPA